MAAVAPGKRKFGGSEIAFGTNEHQDICRSFPVFSCELLENFLEVPCIGLKRADQLQIEARMILEKLAEGLWDLHLRQPVLSTLLCRLDCNCLPLGLLGSGGFVSQTADGASARWSGLLTAGPTVGAEIRLSRTVGAWVEGQAVGNVYRQESRMTTSLSPSLWTGLYVDL